MAEGKAGGGKLLPTDWTLSGAVRPTLSGSGKDRFDAAPGLLMACVGYAGQGGA